MSIAAPEIDPVIINIWGPFSVSWYSLAYIAGIMLGYYYFIYIDKKCSLNINQKVKDNIVSFIVIGILVGGRLGYVLFYDLDYFISNPQDIIKTWQGGMSFHGGLIGVIMAVFYLAKKYKISFILMLDIISCVGSIGIFFGRIANFINKELVGLTTDMPWGIKFSGIEGVFHPSQIYEALLEGLLIFIVQAILLFRYKLSKCKGALSVSFLLQYSLYRFFVEFFRQPDEHIGYIGLFTMGQILSLLMFSVGLFMLICVIKNNCKNYVN